MKRYQTYKDSGVEWIGEVPEHWSALRLKWVCNFLYGESLSAQERENGIIPVYGSNGIVGYHNRSITEKPCIIVGRKGSFGKVTFSEKKCYPIDTTYYIDCTSTKNYMRWLWYLLPLLKMDEFSRDSAVPGLNREDAYRNIVTLPSSYEQQQIAAYLDRKTIQIDNLISKKQKLIELLKEERAAIINQAVTKGLNPDVPMKDSGIEWLGEIPAHWEVKRLKYVAKTVQTGTTPSSLNPEYFIDGEIDWFTPVDFGDSLFLSNSNRKLNRLAIDDNVARLYGSNTVLLVGIGATLGKVGIIKRTASSNQQINVISFKDNYNPEFGAYYFQAISDIIVSMSNAATLPILNQTQTKEIMTPVPPQKERDEIVGFINQTTSKIDQTISKIEKQIGLLKEFRTALISKVVTGKIDVRDGGSNG